MGEYFDTREADHRCSPPNPSSYPPPDADGWRCSCGRAWVRRLESQHGETWYRWARSERHDRKG